MLQQFSPASQLASSGADSPLEDYQERLLEADAYLRLFHHECGIPDDFTPRLTQVQKELAQTGTWSHTYEELAFGARVAWRNNTRCIGRLHWKSLVVRDMRHLSTAVDIFEALIEHIRFATNGGKLRS